MIDLVIRGGRVVDGTGRPARTADIAVEDGRIAAVGRIDAPGAEEIDADGLLVTPGFVDPHTHYDGQATWDPLLTPSFFHGVTTVVMGNCGVGFAPVRPDRKEFLIALMEGVEDIPGTALHEGIQWAWESFPEYLDALDGMQRAIDIGTHLPHGSLRAYVMDERGADNEPATDEDIDRMAELAFEAVRAGALGFSTNRLAMHTSKDGRPVPGTYADERELFAIGRAVARAGGGVVEIVSAEGMGTSPGGYHADVDWGGRLAREAGIPVTLCLTQIDNHPDLWRDVLGWIHTEQDRGAELVPQVAGRPLGILIGLGTKHPFQGRAAYEEVVGLPVPQRAAALRDPARRQRLLEQPCAAPGVGPLVLRMPAKVFPLGSRPDYEPAPETSVAAQAAASGRTIEETLLDLMLEQDGRALLLFTLGGYARFNLDHIGEMLSEPSSIMGLADGGAHCSLICDASAPTSVLSYWARDRTRGPRLPVELAVAKMTSGPAHLYRLSDRGTVAPGMRADLNLIDFDHLTLRPPEVVDDLPTHASRLIQRADGYVATLVAGQVISRQGVETGARPGRLVRRQPV